MKRHFSRRQFLKRAPVRDCDAYWEYRHVDGAEVAVGPGGGAVCERSGGRSLPVARDAAAVVAVGAVLPRLAGIDREEDR